MDELDLKGIEAGMERQLERTRRIPTEPLISIRAEALRVLIAAAKRATSAEQYWTNREADIIRLGAQLEDATQRDRAALSDKLNGTPCAEIRWRQERAENLELRALIARAGEVLRPIVNIALLYDGDRATGGVDGIKFPDEWPVYARASECNEIGSLSVGWFRAARAIAADLRKAGEGA